MYCCNALSPPFSVVDAVDVVGVVDVVDVVVVDVDPFEEVKSEPDL